MAEKTLTTIASAEEPSRRSMLSFLTATVAGVAAPPAVASAAKAPKPQEAPELLEIGAKVPGLVERLRAAKTRMIEAVAAFNRLKPAIPPEIVPPDGHRWAVMVRDVDNQPARAEDGHGFLDVYDHKQVRAHIVLQDISHKTKEGRQLRRVARLAQKFERDYAAAVQASGFWEARSAVAELRFELQNIAEAATAIKPTTAEGIAVYAAIILAVAGTSYEDRPEPILYQALGLEIAKAATAGRSA